MGEVTHLVDAMRDGDSGSAAALLPMVYEELRRLAAHRLSKESPGHTVQATALVHEAYLRLIGSKNSDRWENRGHFFAAAAEAMRRILIDHARAKGSIKRGGGRCRLSLPLDLGADAPLDGLVELDEALEKFAREEPEKACLVKLRFFAGLSMQQAADVMGISRATAHRHWLFARAWLYAELGQFDIETVGEETTH